MFNLRRNVPFLAGNSNRNIGGLRKQLSAAESAVLDEIVNRNGSTMPELRSDPYINFDSKTESFLRLLERKGVIYRPNEPGEPVILSVEGYNWAKETLINPQLR